MNGNSADYDAPEKKSATDVTTDQGTGSTGHESERQQPPSSASGLPPVPGMRSEGGNLHRGQPRHSVPSLPLVRLREHAPDGRVAATLLALADKWETSMAGARQRANTNEDFREIRRSEETRKQCARELRALLGTTVIASAEGDGA